MAMIGKLRRRRFGEIFVGEGLINQEQLEEALIIQKDSGDTLGTILLDLGYITETDIVKGLSIQYQLPCLRPTNYEIDRKLAGHFDAIFLHRHLILPIDKMGNLMIVLLSDIPTKSILEEAQKVSSCDLAIYLSNSSEIKQMLMDIAPISAEDEELIRASRNKSRDAKPNEELAFKKDLESSLQNMNLSSDKLLSSLDEAWESIFVESGDGEEE